MKKPQAQLAASACPPAIMVNGKVRVIRSDINQHLIKNKVSYKLVSSRLRIPMKETKDKQLVDTSVSFTSAMHLTLMPTFFGKCDTEVRGRNRFTLDLFVTVALAKEVVKIDCIVAEVVMMKGWRS